MRPYIDESKITREEAGHVLAHFGAGGMVGGAFSMDLVMLIARADPTNRARLALGFPGYVAAVHLAQNVEGGTAKLQRIAAIVRRTEDLVGRYLREAGNPFLAHDPQGGRNV